MAKKKPKPLKPKSGAAGKPGRKSTRTVVSERIDMILRLRLDGAQAHDLLQYAAEVGWGVCERTVFNYIKAADELLVERRERSFDKLYARHVAQRDALLARAINAADYGTAARILADSAKLQGLYPPERSQMDVNHGLQPPAEPLDLSKLTDEQLEQFENLIDLAKPVEAESGPGAG